MWQLGCRLEKAAKLLQMLVLVGCVWLNTATFHDTPCRWQLGGGLEVAVKLFQMLQPQKPGAVSCLENVLVGGSLS